MKFLFSSECKVCYWPECLFKIWLIQLAATHPAAHQTQIQNIFFQSATCNTRLQNLSDEFNMLSPWCEIPVRVKLQRYKCVCALHRATYVLPATLVSVHQQAPFPGQLVD